MACILEGNVPFINGSPQNTFVPGAIELAEQHGAFIGGDDFKSGQTKMKSALVDFLINAGIKLTSIASYNHLGNNDGKNLSSQKQFRSKEISKSNVVDDMVEANTVLYEKGEHPDHTSSSSTCLLLATTSVLWTSTTPRSSWVVIRPSRTSHSPTPLSTHLPPSVCIPPAPAPDADRAATASSTSARTRSWPRH